MESEIVLLIILVFFSAFFSGSEIAMFSLSEVDIRILVEKNISGAKILAKMMENPSRLLATILIGNNLANIAAAGLATVVTEQYFQNYAVSIAVGFMTVIILIFGEITPKGLCTTHAKTFAPSLARPLSWFHFVFYPVSYLLEKFLSKITPQEKKILTGHSDDLAEVEVRTRAQLGVEEGTIEQEEFELITNAFEFQDTTIEEIMIPKSDIMSLPAGDSIDDHLAFFMNLSKSRIPLYEDNPENIIGILYIYDIIPLAIKNEKDAKLKDIMSNALFIPEQMKAAELFRLLQSKNIHIAIVVDEFGQTVGLITMEDLLEELVGEIEDETDISCKLIKHLEDNKYLVAGTAEIEEVNTILGLQLPEEDHRTISGLILKTIQYIPKSGEKLSIYGIDIIVKEASNKKIIKLLIKT